MISIIVRSLHPFLSGRPTGAFRASLFIPKNQQWDELDELTGQKLACPGGSGRGTRCSHEMAVETVRGFSKRTMNEIAVETVRGFTERTMDEIAVETVRGFAKRTMNSTTEASSSVALELLFFIFNTFRRCVRLTDVLCNLASGEVGNQCRHVRVIGHAHWHTRRLLSTLMSGKQAWGGRQKLEDGTKNKHETFQLA